VLKVLLKKLDLKKNKNIADSAKKYENNACLPVTNSKIKALCSFLKICTNMPTTFRNSASIK
jgi:hypothetical protein